MSVSKDRSDFNGQIMLHSSSEESHVVAHVARKYISMPTDVDVI